MQDPTDIVNQGQQQAENSFGNATSGANIGSMGSTLSSANNVLNSLNSNNASASAPAATNSGGLLGALKRLAPTLGSIALPAIADLFTGGLATPFDVGLAGIGGAGGKAVENAASGQNPLQANDITSGLESAGGQLGGSLLSSIGGKAAGGLQTLAANKVAAGAAGDADQAAADEATSLKNAYADVPKGLRTAYDAEGQTSFVKGLGLDPTNPQNLTDVSNNANDILNSNLNDALSQAGPVDMSDYNNIVKNAIADNSGTLGSYDKVAVARGRLGYANTPAAKLLGSLEQQGAGVASASADPTEVRQLISKVQGMAADAKPGVAAATGAVDPVQKATYDTLNNITSQLKDTLYNRPEVTDAVSKLQGNIQAGDVGGNQLLADHLNGVLSGASGGQDILDELSRFTNMNKLGKAATVAQQDIASPATLARATGGTAGSKTSNLLGTGIDLGGAYEGLAGGHPAALLAPLLYNLAKSPTALNATGGVLGKLASGAGGILPTAASQIVANSPNDVSGPAGAGTAITAQGGAVNPQSSVLDQALREAMNNPLNGGLSQIGALLPLVQKQAAAEQAAQGLAQSFNQSGGGQGPIMGLLAKLGGTLTGAPAGNYGAQQQQAEQTISNALGVPTSAVSTPSITQNQDTAQQSLTNIQNLINAFGLSGGSVLGSLPGSS